MDNLLENLLINDGNICPECGKRHYGKLNECIIGESALKRIIDVLNRFGGTYPYILCDSNTYSAAGTELTYIFDEQKIPYVIHIIQREHPMPDELTVGEALMFCEPENDIVIGVGGGVINDTAKIIASEKKVPQIIVATAPSMDGFASATSSVDRNGLKLSLNTKCPDAVIGDTNILSKAPLHNIRAGIGDMLAKYVSLVEWKISHIINDEYYCSYIVGIVEKSLDKCIKNTPKALNGDKEAVSDIMEGLVVSGLCMNYAAISRPASGMEHYISHIIDMRSLEFGTACDYHGIQCGIATIKCIKEYEKLVKYLPDREKALNYVGNFKIDEWNKYLIEKLGKGAYKIIEGDSKEQKYDKIKHTLRLERIISKWDDIISAIKELPPSDKLEKFMVENGIPTQPEEIGVKKEEFDEAFIMAKDIRDKYVLGKLLWDLGLL